LVSGKYVGNRPIKLRKSKWRERTDFDALEKQKVAIYFVNDLKFVDVFSCMPNLIPLLFALQNHIQKKPKMSRKGILHK
jgi:hypothetical protein